MKDRALVGCCRRSISHGLAGRQALRCLPKLLGLDRAFGPSIEDFSHDRARLQALGSHRTNGIRRHLCTVIHNS